MRPADLGTINKLLAENLKDMSGAGFTDDVLRVLDTFIPSIYVILAFLQSRDTRAFIYLVRGPISDPHADQWRLPSDRLNGANTPPSIIRTLTYPVASFGLTVLDDDIRHCTGLYCTGGGRVTRFYDIYVVDVSNRFQPPKAMMFWNMDRLPALLDDHRDVVGHLREHLQLR